MGTTKKASTDAVTDQATPDKAAQIGSEYTAEELAISAKELFDAPKECAAAALRAAGITQCTVSKAKKIVDEFLKKEVK